MISVRMRISLILRDKRKKMENKIKVHTVIRMVGCGALGLFLCTGCFDDYSRNPEVMLGHWKSLQEGPNVTIKRDSLEYYAIVYHRVAEGRECPVRYPLVYSHNSTYIKAECRIVLVYSKKMKTLFLSPGGIYYLSILK